MKYSLFIICCLILICQVAWYFSVVIPTSAFNLPKPVQMVLNGQTPLRDVYQKKELLMELYNALGNETPIGMQFESLVRRFHPKQKKLLKNDKMVAPAYYTLNDWALGMLEFIPFKDLPKVDDSWKNEVSEFMVKEKTRPIYGLENASLENNEGLVIKWKYLLQKYLN